MSDAPVSFARTAALPWLLVAAAFVWALSPLLHPVNVEGFSAAIAGLGERLAQGDLARYDPLHPFNVEFFALSKFGAVLDVALLCRVFGFDGAAALTLVVIASEIALLAATALLARRWSGAPPLTIAVALLPIPGLFENSFFLSDNPPAAALAAGAFLCWSGALSPVRAVLGGALLGLAALTRSDTVLLAAAAPLLFYEQTCDARRCLILLAAAALGGAATWCGGLALFGASIFDVLRVGRHAVALWARPAQFDVQQALLFFGLPGLFLAVAGVVEAHRRQLDLRLAMLVAPLLAVALVIGDRLWQSRQLLTLAPFIATLVAFGLSSVVHAPSRLLRSCLIALVALTALAPQKAALDEGPRALFGWLYSPWRWADWQAGVRADVAVLDQTIASARGGTLALATDDWSVDRAAHQQLTQAGFALAALRDGPAACADIAEIFSRGATRIAHLRIHQPFVPEAHLLDRARFEKLALPCLGALAPSQIVWLRSGAVASEDAGPLAQFKAFLRAETPRIVAVPLDADGLRRLNDWYAREEAEERRAFAQAGREPRSVEAAIAATRAILPFPRPR
ncbi:hypothetical protein M2322_001961 [Rhodoblastus acidophilus]|uniref:hypothetical protein n=1 Tax=Rhodoblastus acidophilus TaxID=1074 RepID=UPI002224F0D1|nr:hypothetical protein [Rhodoblastus acidophilus]MCW2316413.1 hypothetical protein [Rhodoblastus acidophilus]